MKFLKEYNDWKYFTQDEIEEIKETYDDMVIDLDLNPNRFQILNVGDSSLVTTKFNLNREEVSNIRIYIRTINLTIVTEGGFDGEPIIRRYSNPTKEELEFHNQIKMGLDKRVGKIKMLGYKVNIEELKSTPFSGMKNQDLPIGWSLNISK